MARDMILWFTSPRCGNADEGLSAALSCTFTIHHIRSVASISSAIFSPVPTVVFFDLDFPAMEDLRLLTQVKQAHPSVPLFLLTSYHSEDLAVWAFRSGVRDYFVKPALPSQVEERVRTCMQFLKGRQAESRSPALPTQPIPLQLLVSSSESMRKVQAVCQHVATNYHRRVTLGEAARVVGMSDFQLSRLFKRETGRTFKDYLVDFRLQRAETLLSSTIVSITDVACAAGFSDLSNFQRRFRKKNGVTPQEYRKGKKSPHLQESPHLLQESPRQPEERR